MSIFKIEEDSMNFGCDLRFMQQNRNKEFLLISNQYSRVQFDIEKFSSTLGKIIYNKCFLQPYIILNDIILLPRIFKTKIV